MTTQLDPAHITAVVVLTDGDDNASKPGALDSLLKAESVQPAGSSLRVFTIAYGADANRDVLRRIAQASGGTSFPILRHVIAVYGNGQPAFKSTLGAALKQAIAHAEARTK
jgi:Mg-chelatase subunit ChlD